MLIDNNGRGSAVMNDGVGVNLLPRTPRFSIIIPVYNVAPYLRECLDSVLSQTFDDWETICVDDGSVDESAAILDEYAARDKRFRVIHQKNAGVSAARNAAMDVARGEWVWFVDADDRIANDSLAIVREIVERNQVDAVKISSSEDVEPPRNWGTVGSAHSARIIDEDPVEKMLNALFGASQYILRRSIVGGQRFQNYKWLEDILFVVEYVSKCGAVAKLPLEIYFYRQREGSAIHSRRTVDEMRMIFFCQRKIFGLFEQFAARYPDRNWAPLWKKFHVQVYFTFFRMYFDLSGRDRKALLPEWIALQKLLGTKYHVPLEWRIRISLVRFFNSGVLAKPLVLRGYGVSGRVTKLLRHFKR